MTEKYILVLCTCPEDVVAARIANHLVEEKLAACVNRLSRMTSTYRWEDKVQTETEALLMIKTAERLLEPLSARIRELHPYELPEVIALPIEGGSERYLAWLGQSVAP
ncbi:MAG TPA: divalent-cation tolerance protein CutA [Steroidobacteraceae bacterium]|nr:divalent-cation tolerance protein CutA [Steroidobacteraceae bacterium]